MTHRIEISYKITDVRQVLVKKELNKFTKKIKKVKIVDVYTIDTILKKDYLQKISQLLADPISQSAFIDSPTPILDYDFVLEIGYLPGVTDNVGMSAKEIIRDAFKIKYSESDGVYSSRMIFLKGELTKIELDTIMGQLYNPLIQSVRVIDRKVYIKGKGMEINVPKVSLSKKANVDEVNLNVSDVELIEIGKKGIKNKDGSYRGTLALDLTYMKAIRTYFKTKKRNPNDIELESIAQMWSEHCRHTIFADPIDEIKNGLFKTYIKSATDRIRKIRGKNDFCYSVFTDNSGAIEFDDEYLITHKVETHNSPSALDPFGGAVTGIVGVNRDAIGFGLGAKPVINTYGFCFGKIKKDTVFYRDKDLKKPMLSSTRIMEGVIEGVNDGGNKSGIPTPQGFMYFDDSYNGKPLVFVGTVGLIPKKIKGRKLYEKKARAGDYIVMVGGRVGIDGVHGATFSSEVLSSGSPVGAVQIGDPITQKKLSDVIIKYAREGNLYTSITDNGAGGLTCAVIEMAQESGGCRVQLDKVPLKYVGLSAWQIWISESQERMTLSVPKKNWKKLHTLCMSQGVEATVIGEFTRNGMCEVWYKKKLIVDMDVDFLIHGMPKRKMVTEINNTNVKDITHLISKKDLTSSFIDLLSSVNIASNEFISTQYDHEVQGGSVMKPIIGKGMINFSVTVTRPLLTSDKAVALSQSFYPHYGKINPYQMGLCAVDTAVRNLVSVGVDPEKIALLDNFCWCSSNDPKRLYDLKLAAKACYDGSIYFKTPFISGKDSMFNDFSGYNNRGQEVNISILETLLISSIGVVECIDKLVSPDLKFPGDYIYILGETLDELGQSEYAVVNDYSFSTIPQVNLHQNKKLYWSFYKCIKKSLIASSISIERGGVSIALAKCALGGDHGVEVEIDKLTKKNLSPESVLFSETQGRMLVTVSPKNKKIFERQMKNVNCILIGRVSREKDFSIKVQNKYIVKSNTSDLLHAYKSTFKNY